MEINECNFLLLTTDTEKFCMCGLNLSNYHAYRNGMPKNLVIENNTRNNRMHTLNMAYLGTCACDRTQFIDKTDEGNSFSRTNPKKFNYFPQQVTHFFF